MTASGTTTYTYDAEDNRIGVTNGSAATSFVINLHTYLSQVLMQTDPDDITTYYVYGLGLIGQEVSGVYQSYHYDLRGSIVALTDANGDITDEFVYGVYGEVERTSGSTATPFLYNDRDGVMTDENGLYYMRARYYSPETMRFTRQDDLIGSITDPLSLNRYSYVKGNPVIGVDPRGHIPDWVENYVATCKLKYVVCKQYPAMMTPVGDIRFESAISKVVGNKDNIYSASLLGVPKSILGSIIFKEQVTQSLPGKAALLDGIVRGKTHSVGLGAIFSGTARIAWNDYFESENYSTYRLPDSDIDLQMKLATDDRFNIRTMAVVLNYYAKIVYGPSVDIANLSMEDWRVVVGRYNATDSIEGKKYSDKVYEYLGSMNKLLDE